MKTFFTFLALACPLIVSAQSWPAIFPWRTLTWDMSSAQVAGICRAENRLDGRQAMTVEHLKIAGVGDDVRTDFKFGALTQSGNSSRGLSVIAQTFGHKGLNTKPPPGGAFQYLPIYQSLTTALGAPKTTVTEQEASPTPGIENRYIHWRWETHNTVAHLYVKVLFSMKSGKVLTNSPNIGGNGVLVFSKTTGPPKPKDPREDLGPKPSAKPPENPLYAR